MTDKYRPLTAAAVLLVAAIAAVVSYMHVATLALHYGQAPLAAYLLPLSIDGMVATSSLALLRSARAGVSAPWLARTGLVLAVMATLAANVASGLPHGWPGALLAGWPAVAFVISAETAIAMSRRRVAKVATERPADTGTRRAHARPRRAASRRPAAADTEAAILATLASGQDMTNEQLARAVGVSTRTARRYRSRLTPVATGHPD
jgi:DNA-binding CsgD family transcriptional regulator